MSQAMMKWFEIHDPSKLVCCRSKSIHQRANTTGTRQPLSFMHFEPRRALCSVCARPRQALLHSLQSGTALLSFSFQLVP